MKFCILTPRFPFPENGGDVLRINNIARYLKSKNHELVLVSFSDEKIQVKEEYYRLYDTIYTIKRSKIFSLFMSLFFSLTGRPIQCGYYFSFNYLKLFRKVINNELPDIYISHLLRMVPYLEITNKQDCSIIEMTDALSKTYTLSSKAKGSSLKKTIYFLEKRLINRYECHVIKSFPKVALVSASDIQYLQQQCGNNFKNFVLYTNGVDCIHTIPKTYDNRKICFVGNMRTLQNQDAVMYFIKDIFPLIKQSVPDAIFTIIGAEPPEPVKTLADGKNIIVTGFVDDIQAAVSECCVAVAPVRVAAGIQNKVLVSMGCGVPVIMSSLIAGAIPELESGKNCFISDVPETFANYCITLMNDTNIRSSISETGYKMVKEKYSWFEKLKGYEQLKFK